MLEEHVLKHHIQRQIVNVLMFNEYARFTDLRPARVDSNLFSYHLKLLLKQGYVAKTEKGYALSHKGLMYVDRVSGVKMKPRTQPKIITMLFLQNNRGEVLLQKRSKQPYINTWTLPYGKIHIEDPSLLAAAEREAHEKLGVRPTDARHIGDCYIRVYFEGSIGSTTLAHVITLKNTEVPTHKSLKWVSLLELGKLPLAPAVAEIIASCKTDQRFFEEYTIDK